MSIGKLAGSLALLLFASLAITTYLLWEDGRQLVELEVIYPGYASEVANPGYLDNEQLNWKPAAVWQQYMQAQRAKALAELAESTSP